MEPNIKDISEKGKLSEKLIDFMTDLREKVSRDDSDRAIWKQKMITANNQRLGIKRTTNKPYPNAPDIPLPETDKIIKKSVPPLVMSAWAPRKKCLVSVEQGVKETPDLRIKAIKSELAMNMVISNARTDWYSKLCLAADITKQYGFCIFRIVEDFCSRIVHKVINLEEYEDGVLKELKKATKDELTTFIADRYNFDIEDDDDLEIIEDVIKQVKSGETVIEFDTEEIYSYPNVEIPLPSKIIVPPYATDINKSPRVTYEYFYTADQMEERMDKGIFLKKDLKELKNKVINTIGVDQLENIKGRNEGITDNSSDKELFRIHEVCCWYKPEGKSRSEKWVFTFLADIPSTVGSTEDALLQRIPFPFEFEGWNYEKYDNEVKDPRYHASRGVPEQIRAYQETMERALNNMLVRDEMNNTPLYEVMDNSEIMDAHIRFVPGEKLPVKQIGTEIKRVSEINNVDMSSERIIQMLKAFTEEYVGSTDQLFRNSTNKGGGKTLGEIQEGIRQSAGPQNLEVIHWNEVLAKVYFKMFKIMAERLGVSIFLGGAEITREDFNFPAEVRSNGSLEVADKDLATQKAMMRLQVLNPATNPSIAQIQTPDDLYFAVTDWLEKDGIRDPENYVTDPKEIMKDQSQQMKMQLQQMQQQGQMMMKQNQELTKAKGKTTQKIGQDVAKAEGRKEAINESARDEQPTGSRPKA